MWTSWSTATAALLLVASGTAHPGESTRKSHREFQRRNEYITKLMGRDLQHCVFNDAAHEFDFVLQRRRARYAQLHSTTLLPRAPPSTPSTVAAAAAAAAENCKLGTPNWKCSHRMDITTNDPAQIDFSALGQNKTLLLSPEVTAGPYYIAGEKTRSDLIDNEPGVPLWLDLQFIDMHTCEPMPDLGIELWEANATGFYSGVRPPSQALWDVFGFLQKPEVEAQQLKSQALRGVQMTGRDGSVLFKTLVPGFYDLRAHHTHVTAHMNMRRHDNGTLSGGTILYIGQMYYDQDLLSAVSRLHPYNLNEHTLRLNKDDLILTQGSGGGSDPLVHYVRLGSTLQEGVFGWLNIGIDPAASSHMLTWGTYCEADGCKALPLTLARFWDSMKLVIVELSGSAWDGREKIWNWFAPKFLQSGNDPV